MIDKRREVAEVWADEKCGLFVASDAVAESGNPTSRVVT